MKYVVKTIYAVFSVIFLYYLLIPNISFPQKLSDALQSQEPADIEDTSRRSYFTDFERSEVASHYITNFNLKGILPIRLNYPPEEAQSIIRDQTRSTFLEEIVFPFRESVYINGFKPMSAKDTIVVDNKVWVQKITIKHISSNLLIRLFVGILVILTLPSLFKALSLTMVSLVLESRRIITVSRKPWA